MQYRNSIVGVDLTKYKVVDRNVFAFDPMSVIRVHKVPIAINDTNDPIIVSPAYYTFEVIDSFQLLPQYLMMWFQRTEFDRYADFKSDAAVRGGYDWNELCETKVYIPSITRQREIVSEYETLTNRIRLNNQMIQHLEATAQALYRKTFVDNIDKENLPEGWRMGTIGEYSKVNSGYAFSSKLWQKKGIPIIKIGNIVDNTISLEDCDCVSIENGKYAINYSANTGDIVIAMTGATLGKIAIVPQDGFLVNQRVGLFKLDNNNVNAPFLYWTLQQEDVMNEILTVGGDSAQANVSNSDIENIKIVFAPKEKITAFNNNADYLLSQLILKQKENMKLTELQSLLLAKMGQ